MTVLELFQKGSIEEIAEKIATEINKTMTKTWILGFDYEFFDSIIFDCPDYDHEYGCCMWWQECPRYNLTEEAKTVVKEWLQMEVEES